MVKSWSFCTGIILLLISIGIAWLGLNTQDTAFASTPIRLGTPSLSDADDLINPTDAAATPSAARAPLTENEEAGLEYAILSEYRTVNLYRSINEKFDKTPIFSHLLKDEYQHIAALSRQAEKYHITVPTNPDQPYTTTFEKIEGACLACVNAEGIKSTLYEDLITATTHADLIRVYSDIRSNSITEHLPALYLCR